MNENDRLKLQKGDEIRLYRNSDSSDIWKITGIVGEGGSAVCYEAAYGTKTGRLKEFYPIGEMIGGMKRTSSLQLVPKTKLSAKKFRALCDGFEEAYLKLEQAKKADRDNEVMNNFIPPYEILYGRNEDGARGSVYIWTPDDKPGIGFDDYLAEIRRFPCEDGWKKLYEIICILHTLTDCVRAIHAAGLLHLDLKPANFLLPFTGGKEINPNTISLFDVNTLYDIQNTIPRFAGSKGTRAPEVIRGRADNRSDIYSIGAILYQAVIILEEASDELYRDSNYDFLDFRIYESELILHSDIARDPYVVYQLGVILKKCLAKQPQNRYNCCEELLKDLESFKVFLEYMESKRKLDRKAKQELDLYAENQDIKIPKKKRCFCTELQVPFLTQLSEERAQALKQGYMIGIDIGYEKMEMAAGVTDSFCLYPAEIDGTDGWPMAVAIEKGEILTGRKALACYEKDPARGARSILKLLKEQRALVFGWEDYEAEELFEYFVLEIRKWVETFVEPWGHNTVTAVLSLPPDIDADLIDWICSRFAEADIHIRRVVDRATALTVAAVQASGDGKKKPEDVVFLDKGYQSVFTYVFDGDKLFESVFVKDPFARSETKMVFDGRNRMIAQSTFVTSADRLNLEDNLEMLGEHNHNWKFDFTNENAIVLLYGTDPRNQLIEEKTRKNDVVLFPQLPMVLPCCGAALLHDLATEIYPQIPEMVCPCPFSVRIEADVPIRREWILTDWGQLKEIDVIDLPDTEEVIQIRLMRHTVDCSEKSIGGVGIPVSRFLKNRKAYIHQKLKDNHDMIFRIEVV